jgi:hypothetical protein
VRTSEVLLSQDLDFLVDVIVGVGGIRTGCGCFRWGDWAAASSDLEYSLYPEERTD